MSAPDVAAYAARVRAALGDLPADLREDLLEDLEAHLADVAAESSDPLHVRLGPAEAYAEELRTAAGLGRFAGASSSHRSWRDSPTARWVDGVRARPEARAVLAFLPELRPAWWVARAWLGLLALDFLFGTVRSFPVPDLLGLGPLVGLPVLVGAIVLSVRAGRRGWPQDARSRLVAAGVNTVLALLAVSAVLGVQDRSYVYAGEQVSGSPEPTSLVHSDGTPITNLFPYSADGRPLTGVLLYDQDGRPVDDLATYDAQGQEYRRLVVPGAAPAPANSFPQALGVVTYDSAGQPSTSPVGPTPSAPPSATPSPTAPVAPLPPVVPTPPAPETPAVPSPSVGVS